MAWEDWFFWTNSKIDIIREETKGFPVISKETQKQVLSKTKYFLQIFTTKSILCKAVLTSSYSASNCFKYSDTEDNAVSEPLKS